VINITNRNAQIAGFLSAIHIGCPKNAVCEEIDGRAMLLAAAMVRHRGVGGDGVTGTEASVCACSSS
jgi:hypothetical protein